MPKLICVDCQCELKPEFNGAYLIEMFSNPPQPYKIWSTDVWKCRGCGKEIVSGFSQEATEHYQDDFQENLKIAQNSKRCIYSYERPQV